MRTIGLIGGMSWESTALYYKLINERVRDRMGKLHSAPLLLYSYDFEEIKQMQRAGIDPAKGPPAELLIIADRTIPYRLLIEVMFSAKAKEAGYKHFRLIVQKNFPVKPPK